MTKATYTLERFAVQSKMSEFLLTAGDLFKSLPELETQRLRLRQLTLDDADEMFAYTHDPEVARYTFWEPHVSVEQSRAELALAVAAHEAGRPTHWGIEHRIDHRLIGNCGFKWWDSNAASAEINAYLSRFYWNQGLVTEAVREVLNYGFHEMGLHRIQACCEPPNVGSARVLEKVGMTYEGTLRQADYDKGEYHDLRIYSVIRGEWGCSSR
ncbi:MAG TPA: GNAT family protein [Thermomicrobiaceae bacterium]|nr:GNAT family protein [Thermomicrobiaceae bacterium]